MIILVSPVILNNFKNFIHNTKKYLEKLNFSSFNQLSIMGLI